MVNEHFCAGKLHYFIFKVPGAFRFVEIETKKYVGLCQNFLRFFRIVSVNGNFNFTRKPMKKFRVVVGYNNINLMPYIFQHFAKPNTGADCIAIGILVCYQNNPPGFCRQQLFKFTENAIFGIFQNQN